LDKQLHDLRAAYSDAPDLYHATGYWNSYQERVLDAVGSMNLGEMRSGKYPVLATFGFGDVLYYLHPNLPRRTRVLRGLANRLVSGVGPSLPYNMGTRDIHELAYRHCELLGLLTGAKPISDVGVSTYGNPGAIFEMGGRTYTLAFLSSYIRYCFARQHVRFKGDEIVVELGPGSGFQIELLKKLYPGLTVLCFDLPAQIYLCEKYLTEALGSASTVGTETTLAWQDLSGVREGCVHFLGNWQFPLLRDMQYDVFWNAASFGEMEPNVVENYLGFVRGNARWIYLLQARNGKETTGVNAVKEPITLEAYDEALGGYDLLEERDAWSAHRRLSQSGGYFEGVWTAETRR